MVRAPVDIPTRPKNGVISNIFLRPLRRSEVRLDRSSSSTSEAYVFPPISTSSLGERRPMTRVESLYERDVNVREQKARPGAQVDRKGEMFCLFDASDTSDRIDTVVWLSPVTAPHHSPLVVGVRTRGSGRYRAICWMLRTAEESG